MIPSGARVLVATKPVDFRKGAEALLALVRDAGADPFTGAMSRELNSPAVSQTCRRAQ
jgi:transposase